MRSKILNAKKPIWRPFNIKFTETCFSKICELVRSGYSSSITEFIRDAIWEKIERMEPQRKQNISSNNKQSEEKKNKINN